MYVPRITRDIIPDHLVPNDHCRQIVASDYMKAELNKRAGEINVLDLGCGAGNGIDLFKAINPDIIWYGLDLDESPEVLSRTRKDANFYSYDGINIPFLTNTFDIVYSNQVFEHVRYPEKILKEVSRILKSDGCFFGSVSSLEPYHYFSLGNYSPYGFMLLLENAGLKLNELRPSIDCYTLIVRRLLNRPKFFNRFWIRESPFNAVLTVISNVLERSIRSVNRCKLLFCGQFCFKASTD